MDFLKIVKKWAPLILAIMVIICHSAGANSDGSDEAISEILVKYGLPIGLLPDSVKSYSLADDGSFSVDFGHPCYVHFNYLVYYEKSVTGKLSYGKITDLKGIQAKELFVWVNVVGMEVDLPSGNFIYFNVGIISKKIDISWFKTVHACKKSFTDEPCDEIDGALQEQRAVE